MVILFFIDIYLIICFVRFFYLKNSFRELNIIKYNYIKFYKELSRKRGLGRYEDLITKNNKDVQWLITKRTQFEDINILFGNVFDSEIIHEDFPNPINWTDIYFLEKYYQAKGIYLKLRKQAFWWPFNVQLKSIRSKWHRKKRGSAVFHSIVSVLGLILPFLAQLYYNEIKLVISKFLNYLF